MTDTFHVVRLAAGQLSVVRALTADETVVYRRAIDHLNEFHKSPTYLELVLRNEAEFQAGTQVWKDSAERLHSDRAFRQHHEIEVNRRLINYLSSARLFLDHHEARLKRRYTAHSSQVISFLKEANASYDGHFEYRFLYKLRNFAQHFGTPAGHAQVTGRLTSPASQEKEYKASLLLDLENLLKRGGDLWGSLRTEIAALGPTLDVAPYLPVMTRELGRIQSSSQAAERASLLETGMDVARLMAGAIGEGATPGVANLERQAPETKIKFLQPPFALMEWLGIPGFENPL